MSTGHPSTLDTAKQANDIECHALARYYPSDHYRGSFGAVAACSAGETSSIMLESSSFIESKSTIAASVTEAPFQSRTCLGCS